jgi:hypothetical protein
MRRRITIMACGLLIAGVVGSLAAESAQAAVVHPHIQAALTSLGAAPVSPSGPALGPDVELFAADSGVVTAAAALFFGIRALLRRRSDDHAVVRLSRLKDTLGEFRMVTDSFRRLSIGLPPGMPETEEMSARKEEVRSRAADLFVAASPCGPYGEKVVQAARQLMKVLCIDFPEERLLSVDIAAAEAELEHLPPSQAKQFIAKQLWPRPIMASSSGL